MAALALARRGHEVDVYEQAKVLKEVGAGLQISANGTRVLGDLGILERVLANAFQPTGKEVRLWSTGKTWRLFDLGTESIARYGFPYVTTHRGDLHDALTDALASGAARTHCIWIITSKRSSRRARASAALRQSSVGHL